MRAGSFKAVLAAAGVLVLASVGLAAPAGAVSGTALYGFGTNGFGELGNGTTTTSLTPVPATLTGTVRQIATGLNSAAALMSDGTVWTWGENNYSQLGQASPGTFATPRQVSWLSGVVQVALSPEGNGFAVKSDGTVWAWGDNTEGQRGNGTTATGYTPPSQVMVLSGITQVAAGGYSQLALRSDGTVWAWGQNGDGQLGDGTTTSELLPEQVPGLTGITQIASGGGQSFAVRSDGTLFSWGFNSLGQLGNGTTTTQLVPAPVPGLTGVTQVATNGLATLAVAGSTARVWAWGDNHCGDLGDGTTTNHLSPEQIGLTGVTQLAMGQHWLLIAESGAVRSDGTLWTWGCNSSGELGFGTVSANALTPTQVTALTGVSQFVFGADDNAITQCCQGAYGLAVGQIPTTLVPSLTGDTVATAGTALRAAGLVLGTVTNVVDPTCGHIGKVMSQSPVAGTRVNIGSAVALRVGTRPAPPAVCQ